LARYLFQRLVWSLAVLVGVTVVVFLVLHVLPGDPALFIVGGANGAAGAVDPAVLAQVRRDLGFDRPLLLQYLTWLAQAVQGRFGRSLATQLPVADLIVQALPVTVELTVLAIICGMLFGVPAGMWMAVSRRLGDRVLTGPVILAVASPNFFIALVLVLGGTHWLPGIPTFDWVPPWANLGRNLLLMIYPTLSLGAEVVAVVTQYTRAALRDVLAEPYITVARAKGLPAWAVFFRHALRCALIPIVTIVGVEAAFLLGGVIIVETVFGLPGIGQLLIHAIEVRDYTVIQGVTLFIATATVVVNWLTDLCYVAIDPRLSYA
jgi:peptide/nickel transport system permease protein